MPVEDLSAKMSRLHSPMKTSSMLQRAEGNSADDRTISAGTPVARSAQLATSATASASERAELIAPTFAWS